MRCCFVIEHIGALGGTERSASRVMTALAQSGEAELINLVEVAPVGPPVFDLHESIVRDHFFDRKVSLLREWPNLVRKLRRYVRQNRIDTVIVVESTHALYAVPALIGTGVRCIVWEHFNFGYDLGKRKRRIGRIFAARWADDIVTLTQRDVDLWRAGTKVLAAITPIANAGPQALKQREYPMKSRTVFAAGRLTDQKGFDRLIDAWKIVRQHSEADSWDLVIVGDGPKREALQAQVDAYGLSSSISLLPATSNVADYFHKAAIYACSSRHEGLPMVLLEALSVGLPIVSFDCETGPAEVVGASDAGILIAQDDIDSFAHSIIKLMGDNESRCRMSRAAINRSEAFSIDAVLARWISLLRVDRNRVPDGVVQDTGTE